MGEAWALMQEVLDCAVLVANDAMASGAAIRMTKAALYKESGSERVLQDTGSAVKVRESDWLGHGDISDCLLCGTRNKQFPLFNQSFDLDCGLIRPTGFPSPFALSRRNGVAAFG